MSHASVSKMLVAAVGATLLCGTAFADELSNRKALDIEPTFLSVPLPSGSLTLDLSDSAVVSVMGISHAEAEQIVASRSVTGISAAVLPAVVGDLFGVPPMTSNWESFRAAVSSKTSASRPTVGVDD
jgi:hypothetical protein